MYLKTLMISLLVAAATVTQAKVSTTKLSSENILADSLADLGQYKQALNFYKKAYKGYVADEDWFNQASVLIEIANMQVWLSRFSEAVETANIVLNLNENELKDLKIVKAGALRALGLVYDYSNKFDKAIQYYKQSQELYIDTLGMEHPQVAAGYNNISAVYYFQAKHDSSILYIRKAFKIIANYFGLEHPSIRTYYGNFAVNFRALGQYDSSLFYFQKDIHETKKILGADSPFLAGTYTNFGEFLMELGEYEKAIHNYNKSLDIDLNTLEESQERVASTYSNIGMAYINVGSRDVAYDYFQKALSIQKEIFNDVNGDFGVTYNNLGMYWQSYGESDKAIDNFKLSAENFIKTHGNDHPYVAEVFQNLALIYIDLNKYDSAQFYLDQASKIQRSVHGDIHKDNATNIAHQAVLHFERGNFNQGISKSEEAITLFQQLFGLKHPHISKNLYTRAEQYARFNILDSALITVQRALMANSPNFNNITFDTNPKSLDYLDFAQQVKNLDLKIKILRRLYEKENNSEALKSIIIISKKADTLINNTIDQSISFVDRIGYVGTAKDLYKSAVSASAQLYHDTNQKTYLEDLFFFTERSQSILLKFSLNDEDAKSFSGIPDTLLQQERTLKRQRSAFMAKIHESKESGTETSLSYFEGKLFSVDRKLDSIQDYLSTKHPDYFQLKYQNNLPELEEIQDKLDDNQALIEYFEEDSLIHILFLTNQEKRHHTVPFAKDMRGALHFFSNLKKNSESGALNEYKRHAYHIYHQLLKESIASLPESTDHLIIVPSSSFASIPFDILLQNNGGSNYRELAYLFKEYSVSYAYSASLLYQESNEIVNTNNLLAFAPTYQLDQENAPINELKEVFRDNLVPLIWNSGEAKEVASQFDGTTLIGEQATEKNFKNLSNNYQILHLAMHALVDHEESMQSKLVFTQDKDSIEDGMLHTYELLNMDIPAELVVLSACNTGIGEIKSGEGVMSLARGFAYAGVPSIVMSHWNVNDRTTAHLMTSFYRYLAQDYPKNVALRKAKLDFLENANEFEANPYYWGGFVLLGDVRPLNKGDQFTWLLAGVGFFIMLLFGVSVLRRRNSKG